LTVSDPAAPNYSIKVGERLRAARKDLRLSLQAVEAQSNQEFKASVLGAYERGERAISVLRLQRLASFYGVPVDSLLPATSEVSHEDGDMGLTIDLRTVVAEGGDSGGPASADLLGRYVALVRARRRNADGPLMLRGEDLQTLSLLLGIPAEEVRRRVGDLATV
jgi:transcriptional regulator with XRE-family HTH domain